MDDATIVPTLASYAAIAFLIAGLLWFGVGSLALRRARRVDGGALFSALGTAAYVTGAAFLLAFAAWLG